MHVLISRTVIQKRDTVIFLNSSEKKSRSLQDHTLISSFYKIVDLCGLIEELQVDRDKFKHFIQAIYLNYHKNPSAIRAPKLLILITKGESIWCRIAVHKRTVRSEDLNGGCQNYIYDHDIFPEPCEHTSLASRANCIITYYLYCTANSGPWCTISFLQNLVDEKV